MTVPAMVVPEAFAESCSRFGRLVGFLDGNEARALSHAELEEWLACDGRDLLRQLLQDHLDLRATREQRLTDVCTTAGARHGAVEAGHERTMVSVFGAVIITRLAYRRPDEQNLYPADGWLNVPTERHSHGLRRIAAIESSRGSFDDAASAITQATGQQVAKRQVEALARRAAVDVEAFYQNAEGTPAGTADVLVLSADGKGIVMRPPSTAPGHRGQGRFRQAHHPPLPRREAQPQAHRRGGRCLLCDPGDSSARRHSGGWHGRRSGGNRQVAHR